MASFNPIVPGSAWAQVFRLTGLVDFAGGETLRASFRKNSAEPQLLVLNEGSGITRDTNDYTIGLTGGPAGQSALFDAYDKISFDLYAVKAGVQRALGLRVHVPVVDGL